MGNPRFESWAVHMSCNCPNGTVPCQSNTPKEICRNCRKKRCGHHSNLSNFRTVLKTHDDWIKLQSLINKWMSFVESSHFRSFDSKQVPEKFPCLCYVRIKSESETYNLPGGSVSLFRGSDDSEDSWGTVTDTREYLELEFLYVDELKELLD